MARRSAHKIPTSQLPLSASMAPNDAENVHDLRAEVQEQVMDESMDDVVMAVDMRDKGTVGCCYYLAARETIFLMVDIKSAGLDIIDLCKYEVAVRWRHSPLTTCFSKATNRTYSYPTFYKGGRRR